MTALLPGTDPAHSDRPAGALSIFCLLPTLNPYGGVVSVVNAVNIWIAHGHRVQLGCLSRHPEDLVHPRTEPIYLPDSSEIVEVIDGSFDILLATSWHTVEGVTTLATRGGVPWYFVQDYEPAFYEPGPSRDAAEATYAMIANRVVKTAHLQQTLAQHGWQARRIPPGMNLDIFYPRNVEREGNRVLAMARPPDGGGADHRGFEVLTELYEWLHRNRPDLDLCVFGSEVANGLPDAVTNFGRLDPASLPALYSSAAVFVDTSRWHGFGRTGVEAMACATPTVLTKSGGINEYARHEENSLLVPVDDADAAAEAVCRLLDDADLATSLGRAGHATVQQYSDRIAASALIDLFRTSIG